MLLKKIVPTLAVGLALSMGAAAPALAADTVPNSPTNQAQVAQCHDKAFFENLGKQVAEKVGDMPKGTTLDMKKLTEMKDFIGKAAPELDVTKAATALYAQFQKEGLTKQGIADAVVKAASDQGVIKDCKPGDTTKPGDTDKTTTPEVKPAEESKESTKAKDECHDKAFFEGKVKELIADWGDKVTYANFSHEETKEAVKAGFDKFLPGVNFDKAYNYIKGAIEAKTWSNSANLQAAIMDAINEQGLISESCEVPGGANGENASGQTGDQNVLGAPGDGLAKTGSVIGLTALGALACGASAAGTFAAARRKAA